MIDMDKIEQMFSKIVESTTNINHNSTTSADALVKISISFEKLCNKLDNIENKVIQQTELLINLRDVLLKWVVRPIVYTLCIIAGGYGVIKFLGVAP